MEFLSPSFVSIETSFLLKQSPYSTHVAIHHIIIQVNKVITIQVIDSFISHGPVCEMHAYMIAIAIHLSYTDSGQLDCMCLLYHHCAHPQQLAIFEHQLYIMLPNIGSIYSVQIMMAYIITSSRPTCMCAILQIQLYFVEVQDCCQMFHETNDCSDCSIRVYWAIELYNFKTPCYNLAKWQYISLGLCIKFCSAVIPQFPPARCDRISYNRGRARFETGRSILVIVQIITRVNNLHIINS